MSSRLTTSGLQTRALDFPVQPPLETASGIIGSAPLVLLDLLTEEGVTGHSYVFCYTPLALVPAARLVSNLGALIEGDASLRGGSLFGDSRQEALAAEVSRRGIGLERAPESTRPSDARPGPLATMTAIVPERATTRTPLAPSFISLPIIPAPF